MNSVTLQSDFYRVSKTKIRTKNETRKTQKQVGFLGLVVFVGPSVEPQPGCKYLLFLNREEFTAPMERDLLVWLSHDNPAATRGRFLRTP